MPLLILTGLSDARPNLRFNTKQPPERAGESKMENQAPSKITLYRGYIVHFYDAKETVEEVRAEHGGLSWQSVDRLKAAMTDRLEQLRGTGMYRDFGGYVEAVEVSCTVRLSRDANVSI